MQTSQHRRELEEVQRDVNKMRAVAEEQEGLIQEGYAERERLRRVHVASEVDLEMALRSNTALQSQLQVSPPPPFSNTNPITPSIHLSCTAQSQRQV